MKTKKFEKKLALNKETITHLGNEEMYAVNGGDSTLVSICFFCGWQTDTCETCVTICTCNPNC